MSLPWLGGLMSLSWAKQHNKAQEWVWKEEKPYVWKYAPARVCRT
jgi:hypothetical protein